MGDETVRVAVRCRPPNSKEETEGRKNCVFVDSATSAIRVVIPPGERGAGEKTGGDKATAGTGEVTQGDTKSFTFDYVYDVASTQRALYEETAFPLVESTLAGYNGTIFAYGQTGSGKTWSMQGLASPPDLRGIIPNSFEHIFEYIKATTHKEFLVRCSFLEIYNEEIRDLLSADYEKRQDLREDPDKGVFVPDLTFVAVDTADTMEKVMTEGNKHRQTGATAMNATSSRSHSIFTVVIEASETKDGRECITRGKLNLVDLAGSERISKTGATGTRMKEGIKINLSLTALGNVISALVDGKTKHIPYRDSKLTRLLQDSLGGNTRTVMLAAINGADYNYEETISTLRYANRAKNIKNKPTINEDPKDALLRQYKDEIERLKAMLAEQLSGAGLQPDALNAILAKMGGGGAPSAGAGTSANTGTASVVGSSAATTHSHPAAAAQISATTLPTTARGGIEEGGIPDETAAATTTANTSATAGIANSTTPPSVAHSGGVGVSEETLAVRAALEAAREDAERERQGREELSQKLAALQHMLLASGTATGNGVGAVTSGGEGAGALPLDPSAAPSHHDAIAEVEAARQQHEARKVQLKLRQQKKLQAKMREEQAALADEKQSLEEDKRLLSSDLSDKDKALKRMRAKYASQVEAVNRELADARDEWTSERESLMSAVREQAKEMKMLEQLVLTFLSPTELSKAWERSEWDEESDKWMIPRLKPKAGWRQRNASSLAVGTVGSAEGDGDGGAFIVDDDDDDGGGGGGGTQGRGGVRGGRRYSNVGGNTLPELGLTPVPPSLCSPHRSDGNRDFSSGMGLPVLMKTNGITLATFGSWNNSSTSPTRMPSVWAPEAAVAALPTISTGGARASPMAASGATGTFGTTSSTNGRAGRVSSLGSQAASTLDTTLPTLPTLSAGSNGNGRSSAAGKQGVGYSTAAASVPTTLPTVGKLTAAQVASKPSHPRPVEPSNDYEPDNEYSDEPDNEYADEGFDDDNEGGGDTASRSGSASAANGGSCKPARHMAHRKLKGHPEAGLPGLVAPRPLPPTTTTHSYGPHTYDSDAQGVGISVLASGALTLPVVESGGGSPLDTKPADFFANAAFGDGFAVLPGVGVSSTRTGLGANTIGLSSSTLQASGSSSAGDGGRPGTRGATRNTRQTKAPNTTVVVSGRVGATTTTTTTGVLPPAGGGFDAFDITDEPESGGYQAATSSRVGVSSTTSTSSGKPVATAALPLMGAAKTQAVASGKTGSGATNASATCGRAASSAALPTLGGGVSGSKAKSSGTGTASKTSSLLPTL